MKEVVSVISDHPYLVTGLIVFILIFGAVFSYFFKLRFKKGKPIIEKRSDEELAAKILAHQEEIKHLEEKQKFSHTADFYKLTENGEYIGYSIAKKPYVEIWCDGNWTTEEYHDEFDRFERLWDQENEIIIYGKNPNIPSDLYHIIEKKAKDLPSLTIYCSHTVGNVFVKYFADFTNVKVVQRS